MKLLTYGQYIETTFHHHVPIPGVGRTEFTAWCNDPARPGYYRVDTAWNIDALGDKDQDEYLVMMLHLTDANVAFEARMRWS